MRGSSVPTARTKSAGSVAVVSDGGASRAGDTPSGMTVVFAAAAGSRSASAFAVVWEIANSASDRATAARRAMRSTTADRRAGRVARSRAVRS